MSGITVIQTSRSHCFSKAGLIVVLIWAGITGGLDVTHAQFMRLTFEIESELEAEEMNPLSFGEVTPGIGIIEIPMGDPDMGTYSLSGPQNLTVDMAVDLPEYLELEGETTYRVPMRLEVAYANRNENNIDQAIPVQGSTARFQLREDAPSVAPDQPAPSATAFIYVFGEIEVGDIPPGTYEADVHMTVEYE